MPRVGAIGLRAALGSTQRARLRRLGQLHFGADGAQLLDHKAPARRRLERGLDPLALEARQKAAEALTLRRPDPAAPQLARRTVKRIPGDLLSVPVKSHYDRHRGPPQAPSIDDICADHPRLSRGGPWSCHLSRDLDSPPVRFVTPVLDEIQSC